MPDRIPNLRRYVEAKNVWRRIAKDQGKNWGDVLDPDNLTADQAEELFQCLDGDMSPENLCCDGEISGAEVKRRATYFKAAFAELIRLGWAPRYNLHNLY